VNKHIHAVNYGLRHTDLYWRTEVTRACKKCLDETKWSLTWDGLKTEMSRPRPHPWLTVYIIVHRLYCMQLV